MSDQDNKRPLWPWVLGIMLGWVVLATMETQIVKYLDRQIRTDRQIFTEYIEQLPNRLELMEKNSWRGTCNTQRVGLFWTYQICLTEIPDTKETRAAVAWGDNTFPCDLPYFKISYIPPRRHFAILKSESWWSTYVIEKDKSICYTPSLDD